MIFWICLAITLVAAVWAFIGGTREEDIGLGVSVSAAFVILGGVISLLVIGVSLGVTAESDAVPVETTVTEYQVAEGSKISLDGSRLEFIYVEDGVPEKFSESVRPVEVSGTGETVTVTKEHFEHGTGVVPWGHGYSKHSAIVE